MGKKSNDTVKYIMVKCSKCKGITIFIYHPEIFDLDADADLAGSSCPICMEEDCLIVNKPEELKEGDIKILEEET